MASEKKNVVVIGGGFAGTQAAKALEETLPSQYRVILIEKQTHFFFNIAALRAAVENIDDKVFIPYANLFKKDGRFIQAEVTAIHKNSVDIHPTHEEFGSTISFEYAVIATGAEYSEPAKTHNTSKKENAKHLEAIREAVGKAEKIVIIGGGPVGLELAGEIKGLHPKKEVTIIEGGPTVLSSTKFPEKFKIKAKEAVEKAGINLVLNEKVVWESGLGHDLKARTIRTESGKEFPSDLQFVAFGLKPRGEIIKTLDSALFENDAHTIKVRETLQVDSDAYPHIYAIGDVTNIKEVKLAMKAAKHSDLVAKNIVANISKTSQNTYVSDPDLIVITLGKSGGIGYFPFFGGITIGNFLTKTIKSKGLFIDRYWKILGSNMPA